MFDRLRHLAHPRERLLAAFLSVLAGVVVFLVASELFPYHSSNHDEGVYLQQAATLLDGQLQLSPGALADAVRPWFFLEDGGRLYPKYQPLPAGLYAVGMALFGEPRVTLAAVATGNVALVYTLGAMAFDRRVGLLAAAGFATAPMTLVTSSVFLPYAPTTLCNLAFAVAYLHAHRTGRARSGAVAGAAIGVAFFTRPYTAVLFAAPFLIHATWEVGGLLRERVGGAGALLTAPALGRQAVTAVVGLAFVALTLAYNAAVTGSALTFPYEAFAPRDGPGLGRREILGHSVEYSLPVAVRANAEVVWYLLTRWAPAGALGSLLAGVGLLAAGPARRLLPGGLSGVLGRDGPTARGLLAGLFVSVPAGNLLFWGNYNILATPGDPTDGLLGRFGPFYHFDLLAPLAVFGAAGTLALWRARGGLLTRTDARLLGRSARLGRVLLAGALVAVLLGTSAALVAGPVERNAAHTATYEDAYQPFEERAFENAVVFLPTPYGDWLNHPFQALRNEPGFDGDVVYAMERDPAGDFAVVDAYPDRSYYRYTYRGEWTADPDDREVSPLLEHRALRSGPRLAGETTVGVPDRVHHARVRVETGAGRVTHSVTDPGGELRLSWAVDSAGAHLGAVGGKRVDTGVPVESVDEVVVLVRLTGSAGETLTYRQSTPVRTVKSGVEALWPPGRSVCALVDDCGREGTYLPDRPQYEGVAFETLLSQVNASANATLWSVPADRAGSSAGSSSAATAGSPTQPRPGEAMVMPSCVVARESSRLPIASCNAPDSGRPASASCSTDIERTPTGANSEARKSPFDTTTNASSSRPPDATRSTIRLHRLPAAPVCRRSTGGGLGLDSTSSVLCCLCCNEC